MAQARIRRSSRFRTLNRFRGGFRHRFPIGVSQTADADGWYIYDVNPALGIYDIYDNGLLANLQTSGTPRWDLYHTIQYTDELGNPVTGDEFSIVTYNQGMSVSPTANTSVDADQESRPRH